jgi:hypothetical protein
MENPIGRSSLRTRLQNRPLGVWNPTSPEHPVEVCLLQKSMKQSIKNGIYQTNV